MPVPGVVVVGQIPPYLTLLVGHPGLGAIGLVAYAWRRRAA
jgi:hypothetical protein